LSSITEQKLIDLVIEWVKQNQRGTASSGEIEISDDTDLLSSGLVDSFGFVELILYVESIDGCRVDLTDADPSEFTVIKGLCRIALRSLSPAH
jgi:acyl carrier protein